MGELVGAHAHAAQIDARREKADRDVVVADLAVDALGSRKRDPLELRPSRTIISLDARLKNGKYAIAEAPQDDVPIGLDEGQLDLRVAGERGIGPLRSEPRIGLLHEALESGIDDAIELRRRVLQRHEAIGPVVRLRRGDAPRTPEHL